VSSSFENVQLLIRSGFINLLDKIPKKEKTSNIASYYYQANDKERSTWGCAGLKNLGCICYMNAMN